MWFTVSGTAVPELASLMPLSLVLLGAAKFYLLRRITAIGPVGGPPFRAA